MVCLFKLLISCCVIRNVCLLIIILFLFFFEKFLVWDVRCLLRWMVLFGVVIVIMLLMDLILFVIESIVVLFRLCLINSWGGVFLLLRNLIVVSVLSWFVVKLVFLNFFLEFFKLLKLNCKVLNLSRVRVL